MFCMFLGIHRHENIVYTIACSGKPWIGSGQLTTDKHARDVPFLNTYAKERWEVRCVYYIVPMQRSYDNLLIPFFVFLRALCKFCHEH